MHRSLASMQGLPLLTAAGVRVGEITDALYDASEQRILAFSVDWEEDVIPGPDDLLPITQLLELNADIGTVAEELGVSAGLDSEAGVTQEGFVAVFADLIDCPVRDSDGQEVGTLVDIQFDPQDGSVQNYEVAIDGRGESLMVPPHQGLEVAGDHVVLPADAIAAAHKNPRQPQLGISMLEDEGFEDRVGEDDLEVSRAAGEQAT